jgi:H+/Cl- antiporter ClcA
MKQHVINIICALALIVGGLLIITDGIVNLFQVARVWQYTFNAAYLFIILPACIGASDWTQRLRPDLYGKEVKQ